MVNTPLFWLFFHNLLCLSGVAHKYIIVEKCAWKNNILALLPMQQSLLEPLAVSGQPKFYVVITQNWVNSCWPVTQPLFLGNKEHRYKCVRTFHFGSEVSWARQTSFIVLHQCPLPPQLSLLPSKQWHAHLNGHNAVDLLSIYSICYWIMTTCLHANRESGWCKTINLVY